MRTKPTLIAALLASIGLALTYTLGFKPAGGHTVKPPAVSQLQSNAHADTASLSITYTLNLQAANSDHLPLPVTGSTNSPSNQFASAHSSTNSKTLQELSYQVRFWLNRNRPDLAQMAVDKLALVDPDPTDAYAAQALVDIRNKKNPEAIRLLEKIRALRPDAPSAIEVEEALQGNASSVQTALHKADQLAKIGQVDQALQIYHATFPNGIPENHALQYWQVVSRTTSGWGNAIRALKKMLQESHGNPDYELELACIRTRRYPWPRSDIDMIIGLSRDTLYSERARDCWRDAVMGIPLSNKSGIDYLKQYMEQNPDDLGAKEHLTKSQQYLAHQRQLLADPIYQAKLNGLAYLDKRDYDKARKDFLIAYSKYSQDVEIAGGIGKTYFKQSRYTEATPWFRKARKLEPEERKKWNSLISTSVFWGLLQEAWQLRDAGHYSQAEKKIQKALGMDPLQPEAKAQLIRLKMDQNEFDKASDLARNMPEPQQSKMIRDIRASEARYLHRKSDLTIVSNHPEHAYNYLERANKLNPLDPWITYDLANMEAERGHPENGIQLFDDLIKNLPADPSWFYAYSLFLSKQNRMPDALNELEHIPIKQRDDKIVALQRRLWVSWQIEQARTYALRGKTEQAGKILDMVRAAAGKSDFKSQTDVAFAWLALGNKARARSLLDEIRSNHSTLPADWHLRYAGFLEKAGPQKTLQNELAYLDGIPLTQDEQADLRQLHMNATLDLVRDRLAKGDVGAAKALISPLRASGPKSPEVLDISSQVAQQDGKLDEAIRDLQQSLSENPDKSDYRYKRLAEMLDERSSWVSAGFDGTQRTGTAGQSQLNATAIPVLVRIPLATGGDLVLRSDEVNLSAGTLDLQDKYATKTFGSMLLCQPNCPGTLLQQNAAGRSYTAGYDNQDMHVRLGTTPIGFAVTNLVGDIKNKGDLGQASWSIDLGRRPLTSTLLSYAGTRDPHTGMTWGGVLTTGATLGLSVDRGETNGFWSNFSAYELTGTNVQSNTSLQMMAGWTHRMINEDDRLFATGLSGMLWHFNQDSGEFTFGHGGYYSPQRYISVGVPITYAQRTQRLSYMFRGSVFTSWAQTESSPYYPTNPALQAQAGNPYYSTSSGSSVGYSFIFAWEYQVSPSLFVGNRSELERSPYYAPNSMLLYMRYNFDHSAAMPVLLQPEALQPTYPFY